MRVEGAVNVNIAGESIEKWTNIQLTNTYSTDRTQRMYSLSCNVSLTEDEYLSLVRAEIESRRPVNSEG